MLKIMEPIRELQNCINGLLKRERARLGSRTVKASCTREQRPR